MKYNALTNLMYKMWRNALDRGQPQQTVCLLGSPGIGKCLGEGTPVLLADGRVLPVERIVAGDRLMGPDGKARTVLSTTVGRGPLYRVDPLRGESWVCNDVHVLTLVSTDSGEVVDVGLDAWQKANVTFRQRHKLFSVGVDHFEGEPAPAPIDPYFLGVWFGDGSKSLRALASGQNVLAKVAVSKPDPEIRQLCEDVARQWEMEVTQSGEDSNPTFNLVDRSERGNSLLRCLRDLVGPDISVPECILRGGRETRLAFLAGFIDTDGELVCNCYTVVQKNEDWARDVWWIARSLGLCATITTRTACDQNGHEGLYHVVTISGNINQIPCRLPRRKAQPRRQRKIATRTGFSVVPLGEGGYFGFTLDGDGRFLLGDFTVTHNTASNRTLCQMMTDAVKSDPGLQKLIFGGSVPASIPAAISQELDLSSMLPEDLNGLPFRDEGNTKFCAHEWLRRLCTPGAYGVLVLDDLPASAPMMQVAARQCALERRIHDHRLSPGVFIIVTGNRREDKSAASTLPAHFRNSVLLLDVDLDIDEWAIWYGQQPYHSPLIPAFLRFKQDRLSMLPKDADKRGAFATPRTWTKLGAQFDVAEETGSTFDVSSGLVGEGVATEFVAFCKVRAQLVDPAKVFDDPQSALPRPEETLCSPDKLVAMATALGEIGAARSKSKVQKERDDAPLKLLYALAWATRENREYCGAGVSTFIANGGDLAAMVRLARANRKDKVISSLLGFLKSALMQ